MDEDESSSPTIKKILTAGLASRFNNFVVFHFGLESIKIHKHARVGSLDHLPQGVSEKCQCQTSAALCTLSMCIPINISLRLPPPSCPGRNAAQFSAVGMSLMPQGSTVPFTQHRDQCEKTGLAGSSVEPSCSTRFTSQSPRHLIVVSTLLSTLVMRAIFNDQGPGPTVPFVELEAPRPASGSVSRSSETKILRSCSGETLCHANY